MSEPFGESVAAAIGCVESLPDGSVDCVVACPVADHVHAEELVSGVGLVWTAVHRVLRPGGTTWLILADVPAESGSLGGLPWRAAFALQRDGWLLRNALIAFSPSDGSRHQTGFLLVKQPRYFFNFEAIQATQGKNPGDVVLPPDDLVARCVAAGCPAGGVLLDPFSRPEAVLAPAASRAAA